MKVGVGVSSHLRWSPVGSRRAPASRRAPEGGRDA